MGAANLVLAPTSILPPLRSLETLSEDRITPAIQNLKSLYCPLPRTPDFRSRDGPKNIPSIASTPLVDSGYASGYASDDEDDKEDAEPAVEALATLRADVYERNFATRWLTVFIARAEEIQSITEDVRERLVEDASSILASFNDTSSGDDEQEQAVTRNFAFPISPSASTAPKVQVRLNDDPLTGRDHTDVGLQTWGASIVLSDIMCATPKEYGLTREALGSSPRIIELGAGTGLVSLAVAALLRQTGVASPRIIATDFHPAVLANLRANITTNIPADAENSLDTCILDWAQPSMAPPLDAAADMLIAADVVYAPEHAVLLRNCAARLLAPHGVFWLIGSIRAAGRLNGILNTVPAAFDKELDFQPADGRTLMIEETKRFDKRNGIGRTDESGYILFRIGWA